MTPKLKALQLVESMAFSCRECDYEAKAKQCALIAVDEILELKETQEEYQLQYDNGEWSRELGYRYSKYWAEVKQEIENL